MLSIRQANDLETLADECIKIYQQNNPSVFANSFVIVPNLSVADWLEQRFAQQQGIAARMRYLLWREYAHQAQEALFRAQYPTKTLPPPLSNAMMRWQLFAYLLNEAQNIVQDEQHALHPALQALFNGLGRQAALSDTQIQRLWAYAEETAKIFNDYLAMRPQWLDDFVQHSSLDLADFADAEAIAAMPEWLRAHYQQVLQAQAFLWKECFVDTAKQHAELTQAFIAAAQEQRLPAHILTEQLFIFMPRDVDQSMLDFLQALGRSRDVYVFLYGMSNQRLSDIVDSRWLRRLPVQQQEEQHLSSGHDLFSRFGKQERQRFKLLEANQLAEQIDYLQSPESQSAHLLGQLQDDIRRLDDAVSLNPNPSPEDDSLKIHGCHGLLRQLEVLRGEIVRWLNADSSRRLDDIVILLPDVAAHQDALRAVFPQQGSYDGYTLPTRLTGINTAAVENLWQALSGIYTLADSDFSFPAVKQWLLLPDNCAAYGLSHEDMLYWLDKLAQAGFRRGFDEAHLQETLSDKDYRFSFCYALDRLVTGYAMPTVPLYAGQVAPDSTINNQAFAALNALCRFAEEIHAIRAGKGERINPCNGLKKLEEHLHKRYAHAFDNSAYQAIDKHIQHMKSQLISEAARTLPDLPFKFILRTVAESLSGMQISAEPSGVITIAQLNALQALPYRLIVFLGAENGAFPTPVQDRRYNLLDIASPQLGDRSRRNEDLAAFLHCLCAAKDACWLFYTAVDPIDGEARIPPAPIQELLNYLSENQVPQAHIHIAHSADPFHPEQEKGKAAAPLWQELQHILLQEKSLDAHSWLDFTHYDFSCLPSIAAENKINARHSLDFQRIVKALQKPLSHYLREQNIRLPSVQHQDLGREPLFLDSLEQWQLRHRLIHSEDSPENRDIIAALPILPIGRMGRAEHRQTQAQIAQRKAALFTAAAATTADNPVRTQECSCADISIAAALPVHADQAWLRLLAGKSKAKYWLEAWLWHLLWQSSHDIPLTQKGVCYVNFSDDKKDEGMTLRLEAMPQAQAQEILAQWLKVYHSMSVQPWLWSPESAEAVVNKPDKPIVQTVQKYLNYEEKNAWEFLFHDTDTAPLTEALNQSWSIAKALYQSLFEIVKKQI